MSQVIFHIVLCFIHASRSQPKDLKVIDHTENFKKFTRGQISTIEFYRLGVDCGFGLPGIPQEHDVKDSQLLS